MKTLLIIALIILVAGTFLNEVGHYARTRYDLSNTTDNIVDTLARSARSETRVQAANEAAALAQKDGVEVYQYDQSSTGIQVWTRMKVSGTLLLGRYMAWRAHKPLDTPFFLQDYGTSVFQ